MNYDDMIRCAEVKTRRLRVWTVQLVMPVDKPENNVRKRTVNGGYVFEVPINLPGCSQMGFDALCQAAERYANIHTIHRA